MEVIAGDSHDQAALPASLRIVGGSGNGFSISDANEDLRLYSMMGEDVLVRHVLVRGAQVRTQQQQRHQTHARTHAWPGLRVGRACSRTAWLCVSRLAWG
eukprot:COSAG01_NODE_10862_length_2066_cov_1.655821_3_plen_100_part_00